MTSEIVLRTTVIVSVGVTLMVAVTVGWSQMAQKNTRVSPTARPVGLLVVAEFW